MPWYDRVLKKVNREPVPAVFDDETDDWVVPRGDRNGQAFVKDQESLEKLTSLENKLSGGIVEDYYEGAADYSKTYSIPMRGISIANDGIEHLTFTINGIKRTIYAGEVYSGTLKPFTQISIAATDKYRVEVLS
ncbi:hypothetical protein AB3Z07_21145 [Metabacillus halosaccharovorans]|uniref:hypothetical protein n=1 Tax=Metabacillus halosaccharovorans TaxID=930124 RepID=UPI0034D014BB